MNKKAIVRFALKTIFRQKSRNFFIIFIVCLTCVFSLISAGLFEGKNEQIEKAILATETGLYQVIEKNFHTKSDPTRPAVLSDDLEKRLSGLIYTPELLLKTTILNPEGSQELTLIGIDAKTHEKIFPMKNFIKGTWPVTELNPNGIVIGKKFADKFNLSIGEEVIVTYQDKNKSIQNESLPIVGIYSKNGEGFERSYAYVKKNCLQTLLQLDDERSFNRIIFSTKNKKKPIIKEDHLLLKDWNDLHPELSIMMKFHNGVTRVLIIFMLVIAYVSITTPLNILWEERKGEIKLLRTIGASEKSLYILASVEAIILTFAALLTSIIIWLVLYRYTKLHGLDFSIMGEESVTRGGILISSVVYPSFNFLHFSIIIFFHGALIYISQLFGIKKLLMKERECE